MKHEQQKIYITNLTRVVEKAKTFYASKHPEVAGKRALYSEFGKAVRINGKHVTEDDLENITQHLLRAMWETGERMPARPRRLRSTWDTTAVTDRNRACLSG